MSQLTEFMKELSRVHNQLNGLDRFGMSNFTKELAGFPRGGVSQTFNIDPNEFRGMLTMELGESKIREIAAEVDLRKVTVEDIHHDFYGAGETLLEEVKQILLNAHDKELNTKATRLRALGFTKAAEVKLHDKAIAFKQSATEIQSRLTELRQRYPLTRFISYSDVDQLCEKYNLVLGPASAYTGTIPDANLREIEKAIPLKAEDISTKKSSLCIVAPQIDMNMTHSRRELLSIPDPIVLEPVKGGFYRIITAWGPEAKDPAVIPSYEN